MLREIKVLVLTIMLISFTVTADIIVQPGYGKASTQSSPIHSQSVVTPSEKQRESAVGHSQARLIPIYAHGHQGGLPYQVGYPLHYPHYPYYPHYPHYPQYVHSWPRYAPQKHLRVLKIGGHKVYQPSWFVGHRPIPLAVHHRYKKSVGEQPDSGKSGQTVPSSENSPVNIIRSDVMETGGDPVIGHQSKNDFATKGIFGLNPANFMNFGDLEPKCNKPNERNTNENNESSTKESDVEKLNPPKKMQSDSNVNVANSQMSSDEPNLGNFPDPRPDTPSHKTTTNPLPKNSQEKNPILGSPMRRDEILGAQPVQQEYPTSFFYNYNYEPLSYVNYDPPPANFPLVYVIRCNDGSSKMYDDQQSAIQKQIYQTAAIPVTDYPLNMGYTFSPQTYNYVSSYDLGYPRTVHCALPSYPIPYAQFK